MLSLSDALSCTLEIIRLSNLPFPLTYQCLLLFYCSVQSSVQHVRIPGRSAYRKPPSPLPPSFFSWLLSIFGKSSWNGARGARTDAFLLYESPVRLEARAAGGPSKGFFRGPLHMCSWGSAYFNSFISD